MQSLTTWRFIAIKGITKVCSDCRLFWCVWYCLQCDLPLFINSTAFKYSLIWWRLWLRRILMWPWSETGHAMSEILDQAEQMLSRLMGTAIRNKCRDIWIVYTSVLSALVAIQFINTNSFSRDASWNVVVLKLRRIHLNSLIIKMLMDLWTLFQWESRPHLVDMGFMIRYPF